MFGETKVRIQTAFLALGGLLALLAQTGCNSPEAAGKGATSVTPAGSPSAGKRTTIRLAFFPNVTHGVALVGTKQGTFQKTLGSEVAIEEQVFNAGPAEIEALFANQVDIGYIGPGPAVNGFLKSRGKALRIIAGASSGGAGLVVRKDAGITEVKGLNGKRVASPQVGGTQDISLRHALRKVGLASNDKGGTVAVIPVANPDTLTLFQKKELDAAWVPEPWVARLEKEGNGALLIDERDEWTDKKFATTIVIVRAKFLEENPELVKRFLEAHVETVQWMAEHKQETQKIIGDRIAELTKKPLPPDILTAALSRTDFSYDPFRETVLTFADWSKELGFQRDGREALGTLFDLAPLNAVLTQRKLATIP